jgi:hypothetical protein
MEPMEALHQIVAADRAARVRYDNLRQDNDSLDVRLEALSRTLTDEALEQASAAVEQARAASVADASEMLAALDEQCEAALATMESQFDERKDQCVEQMFRIAVGLA